MKIIGIFLISSIALISCQKKNQKAVKSMDGKWELSNWILYHAGDSADLAVEGETFAEFDNSNLKDGEYYDGQFSLKDIMNTEEEKPTVTIKFDFRVIEDGKKIVIVTARGTDHSETYIMDIDKLEDGSMMFSGNSTPYAQETKQEIVMKKM